MERSRSGGFVEEIKGLKADMPQKENRRVASARI
jgi:hypothetical protein